MVKLLNFDHGYWDVEFGGKVFKVFATRVQTGMEYEYMGRWFDEDDPIIVRQKASERFAQEG